MTLPHVDLGNAYQDVGSGVNSLVKGLVEQRQRQSQLALQEALLEARKVELIKPNYTVRPAINPTTNRLEYARLDENGRQPSEFTGLQAPESQMDVPLQDDSGTPISGTRSRYVPGQPISAVPTPEGTQPRVPQVILPTQTGGAPSYASVNPRQPSQPGELVQMPPGTTARPAPSIPMTVESPTGPVITNVPRTYGGGGAVQGSGGQSLRPKADEADERRARDAFEMVQGQAEMHNAVAINPRAYQDAAAYLAKLDVAEGIPVVGGFIEGIVRQAQSTMSPEAARYFNGFMQFAASRAFSRGGATLTRNEIDYSLSSLAPKPGEDPRTSAQRLRLVNGIIGGSIAGNNAWQRYRDQAGQLGFNFDQALNATEIPPSTPVQQRNPRYKY